MKTLLLLGAAAALYGCGGGDFTDCRIGGLTGTWRFSYTETDGNCGAIADETTVFMPGADPPPDCTVHSQEISADRCRFDTDSTCPLADGEGSQRWTIVYEQTGPDDLFGTGTAQVSHPSLGSCRSTYNIAVTRL